MESASAFIRQGYPGTGVRVTIESFLAAADLVKNDQAECYDMGGRLYIREL